MNLLLLLSALLSALTGIGGSARVPEAAAISASVVTAAQASSARVSVAARPVQALPTLPQVTASHDPATPVVAAPPPYASRRRE